MNELRAIIEAYEEARCEGKQTLLATVVRTSGSVYRRAGARMLITLEDDDTCTVIGAISGGCLEHDVCERARGVLRKAAPTLVRYDTTAADDIVWGLGLGCNGVVEVLLEALTPNSEKGGDSESGSSSPGVVTHPLKFIERCYSRRERGVMATVFKVDGASEARIGGRLLVDEDGIITSDIADDELRQNMTNRARASFVSNRSSNNEYEFGEGRVDAFIEVIEPPVPLVVFGAGADAVPVARLAHELGWIVTIVDHRAAYATTARFPGAHELVVCRPEHVAERVRLDARTATVLMTHNYKHDRSIMKTLLESPARYVGCLGPKQRTEKLLTELRDQAGSFAPTSEQLARLYAPVGLDIGAETPAEIALSILAEIRAVIAGHAAGFLRERSGAIHGESHNMHDIPAMYPEASADAADLIA